MKILLASAFLLFGSGAFAQMLDKGEGWQGANTLGYSRMESSAGAKSADLKGKENNVSAAVAAAAAKAKAKAEEKAEAEASRKYEEFVDKEVPLLPKGIPGEMARYVAFRAGEQFLSESYKPKTMNVNIRKAKCDSVRVKMKPQHEAILTMEREGREYIFDDAEVWVLEIPALYDLLSGESRHYTEYCISKNEQRCIWFDDTELPQCYQRVSVFKPLEKVEIPTVYSKSFRK